MRIITTQGFNEKQKLDAALGYAAWLDYKGTPEAAFEMYQWARDITTSGIGAPTSPSANSLLADTALAVHYARNNDLATALPLFIHILQARRSLPTENPTVSQPQSDETTHSGRLSSLLTMVSSAIKPPTYPPPPDDGTKPPLRDSKERCEEAGIMTYIGEILYAASNRITDREDGLAWTREAVDIAEEELRGKKTLSKDAIKTCRECLETGLGNWAKMVSKLAREEREKKATRKVGGWLGFGAQEQSSAKGRWETEESVVQGRIGRAKDVLDIPVGSNSSGVFFL